MALLRRNPTKTDDTGARRTDDTTTAGDSRDTMTDRDTTAGGTKDHDTMDRDRTPRDEVDLRGRETRTDHDVNRGALARDQIDRQHDSYGGFKLGAAFFGWLSANGLTVLLVAIASAAGVAFGLTRGADTEDAAANAETLGLAGAIVLLAILALGYYAGGYVAGRMARFDGARQGFAVWLIGLLVTAALAVAGVTLGSEYNVLSDLNLPRIPVDEGDATTAGIVALAAVLIVTLLAAVSGGKVGERYHRKVDRAGVGV